MPCVEGNKIHKDVYDFCDFVETVNTVSTPYLLHLLFLPALIIMFLTVIDRCSEDAKWFMFNTAVINVVTGITWEMKRIPRSFGKWNSTISLVCSIGKDVSQSSIFLLAVTRVFFLYCPAVYKKAFARKRLFLWILASDFVLARRDEAIDVSHARIRAATREILLRVDGDSAP
ncbi:hypothetical protein DdX_21286 [Ditylenchus destructor]|uniref:Uncharacterized protein n=1 Tax=Ditylenchus destructor TaxID=166010 RepID=A0AAD4MFY0_9BILA|nr:hypothetical protein DdX_21286 [Ditylenchus destructor]